MTVDRSRQRLGQYFLIRKLGEGAFGDVYLAEVVKDLPSKEAQKQQVAIKILRGPFSEQQLLLFLQEVRTILLNHPHIISVIDFNIEQKNKTPYIVMEYAARGTLLRHYPRGQRLPLETVISYTTQIADALNYAHNKLIIHRDVKPENILVDDRGAIKLADFGLAVIAQSALTSLQDPHGRAGTPWYMAPEQIQGKASRASDQYALAIIIYEWLTGAPPFVGNLLEVYGQHLNTSPEALPRNIPYLTSELEAVIMKALSKKPEERYPSIQDFATALQNAYNHALARGNSSTISTGHISMPIHVTIEELSDKGNALHKAGRYDEAIAVWNQVLRRGIDDAVVYYNRGNAYFQKAQYQKAINDYGQAIQLDYSYAGAYNMRGLAYYKCSEYDRAIEDFEKAITYNPSYAIAYYNRGLVCAARKDYEKAIFNYEQAIQLNLRLADVYNDRGIAYYNRHDYYRAIKDYEQALKLDPNHLQARNNISNAQRKLRERH